MKEIYDWVPWFRALARKIAKGGEQYLIDKARDVNWKSETPALLKYHDENIDPFSFLYFLASKNTTGQRPIVYPSVRDQFDVESTLPDVSDADAYIFPTPPPRVPALFHDGKTFHPGLLWKLFKQVVEDNPNVDPDDFQEVLNIGKVDVTKLTQTLFLINAEYFLPIDNTTGVVSKALQDLSLKELRDNIRREGLQKYLSVVKNLKEAFPKCRSYEIALFSYLQSKSGVSGKFFHVSTHAHGYETGDDHWETFRENNWVYTGGPKPGVSWDDRLDDGLPESGDYPLNRPKPGDGILVRTGVQEGRAIGIVYKNDYADPGGLFNGNSRIHVSWINKSENPLSGTAERRGFNEAEKGNSTYSAFEKTEGYKSSFNLIERLAPDPEPPPKPKEPNAMHHPLNRILYGPPGTGKTWSTVNYAVAIAEKKDVGAVEGEKREDVKARFDELKKQGQIAMVTFHQSFTYEDFIEGIRPVLNESSNVQYELSEGIFREIAERAYGDAENNHVLIIDEINRGNIAKIFGEMITLIESSKRIGGDDVARVILPWSKSSFGVPGNLYVVGTMNTADRSIALLDAALRRRFEFVEMMPELDLVPQNIDGVNCRKLLESVNKRITVLLDREHQIGHTYFLDVEDMKSLKRTFQNRIIPLLEEYFYNDWERIDAVLNQNGFIRKIPIDPNLFKQSDLIDEGKTIYELLLVNDPAWEDPKRYRTIYNHEPEKSDSSL